MEINASINIKIDDLAKIIANLSKEELQLLENNLSRQDKVLHKRLTDVKNKKVKLLNKAQVFKSI